MHRARPVFPTNSTLLHSKWFDSGFNDTSRPRLVYDRNVTSRLHFGDIDTGRGFDIVPKIWLDKGFILVSLLQSYRIRIQS